MEVCPASTLDLIDEIDEEYDKFNIHAGRGTISFYGRIQNIHSKHFKKFKNFNYFTNFLHIVDNLFHNITFIPMYLIILLIFLPAKSDNNSNLTYMRTYNNYSTLFYIHRW